MGTRAGLLVALHVVACSCFVSLSYLVLLAEATEGRGHLTVLDLAYPLTLLLLGLGVWVVLAKRRSRPLALLLVGAEAVVGIALWRALGPSGLNDEWLYIAVLLIGGSGLGAAAIASPPRRAGSV